MFTPVSIVSIASVSPLGDSEAAVWQSYNSQKHFFTKSDFNGNEAWGAFQSDNIKSEIELLRNADNKYRSLDDSVLFAIAASRKAVAKAGWARNDVFGINIGSSRGATNLFEKHFESFLQNGKAATLASPTTTLGNISSWVAHDLQSAGPEISHSITCSTSLHALLNGIAWLNSGMSDKFLVGGSEAPLTPFTVAQMRALKIYSAEKDDFPSRAMDFNKQKNSMILGEGAAICCLEKGISDKAIAIISGIGYATEVLEHNTSISTEADCFQKSMKMALGEANPTEIDAIVMHAPGTIKGDLTEFRAIEKVFGNHKPLLTTNKWQTGHTFGASGILSVEMAVMMLEKQRFLDVPFGEPQQPRMLKKIMVNSVGFGGNAVSVIIDSI
ncbi:beta-ketoacyl synthase N-terminal-like domain-containing protein [Flavobacterium selenitireducens]|uniref:beta-ketoacyl synthase N-terminal-like domain-containing protein n=1 Tax=Flavobacterium selenitireducens TaxID=2722704 RepID=UPI00168BCA47|nr:beta-ketoacyl synthase N-terminal-like domain-containing protein [Flavobacterium selenitireducens]MBD3581772.1 beta-ketoacyl synthase [Flavobacterium selenitireducens]